MLSVRSAGEVPGGGGRAVMLCAAVLCHPCLHYGILTSHLSPAVDGYSPAVDGYSTLLLLLQNPAGRCGDGLAVVLCRVPVAAPPPRAATAPPARRLGGGRPRPVGVSGVRVYWLRCVESPCHTIPYPSVSVSLLVSVLNVDCTSS